MTHHAAMAKVRTIRDNTQRDRARRMRRDDTDAEARLWNALRDRRLGGGRWKRQVPRGASIVDFYCFDAGLVVEVDGGQHADQISYDARRTAWLEAQGCRVLRLWNSDVLANFNGVCLAILDACGATTRAEVLAEAGAA